MKYRTIQGVLEPVSELCFGTMRYADSEGREDQRSSTGARALEAAIEHGVNFIHSSYEYGTRWLTGRLLKAHRKRMSLQHIIKVNVPDWEEPRFSASAFRAQVETALAELGTEQIAVVQHLQRGVSRKQILNGEGDAHRLSQFDEVTTELAEISTTLRREGKIGTVMSFPYTSAYAKKAVESPVYSGIVTYFNLLETEMFQFFSRLRELEKDVVAIRPLAGGVLTSRRIDRDTLPEHDRMRDSSADELYRRLGQIMPVVGTPQIPWEQYAYRFTLADPLVKSTVLGINSIHHLATAASEIDLPQGLVQQIFQRSKYIF